MNLESVLYTKSTWKEWWITMNNRFSTVGITASWDYFAVSPPPFLYDPRRYCTSTTLSNICQRQNLLATLNHLMGGLEKDVLESFYYGHSLRSSSILHRPTLSLSAPSAWALWGPSKRMSTFLYHHGTWWPIVEFPCSDLRVGRLVHESWILDGVYVPRWVWRYSSSALVRLG